MSYKSMVKKKENRLKKSVGFVLSGLIIAISLWFYSQNRIIALHYLDQHATKHTLFLPIKDRKRLLGLMQKLFAEDSFAYTILGTKPICWENYQNPLPLSNWTDFYDSFSKRNRTLRNGWKTWEKYQNLFPLAHLWTENSKCYPGSTYILIVNEDRLNAVVAKNKKDFQDVICREVINGSQLIKEANSHSLIDEVLEGHQALLGIVLGYGRDNSWQFHEGCKKRQPIDWVWGDEASYFGKEVPESDMSDTDYYISHYSCPSFSGDPHSEESLALKAEYLLTKQRVIEYYKGKDFLEATLSLLAGHQ